MDHPYERIAELTRQRLAERGMAAAAGLARRLDISADGAVVLSDRGNLLVHFPAASLVARVATLTAWTRRDPFRWLAREVTAARHVAGRGGPVVPPARSVDAGPHWEDGFAISLWEYVATPPAVPVPPAPAECGALLARFHEAARGCPSDLGRLAPATEQVTDALAVIERERLADTVTIARLRAAHERVLADIEQAGDRPWIVIHGDAHSGNLIPARAGGWLWTDLEDTSCGPAAWDLATLTSRYADTASQEAALRGYAAEAGTAVPQPGELAPFRRARDLEAAVWLVCMAHLYPQRYATRAREHLSAVLASGLRLYERPKHERGGTDRYASFASRRSPNFGVPCA